MFSKTRAKHPNNKLGWAFLGSIHLFSQIKHLIWIWISNIVKILVMIQWKEYEKAFTIQMKPISWKLLSLYTKPKDIHINLHPTSYPYYPHMSVIRLMHPKCKWKDSLISQSPQFTCQHMMSLIIWTENIITYFIILLEHTKC